MVAISSLSFAPDHWLVGFAGEGDNMVHGDNSRYWRLPDVVRTKILERRGRATARTGLGHQSGYRPIGALRLRRLSGRILRSCLRNHVRWL